ncbi:hypothetical protein M7I_1102 [Glarea lozoyensis 74030]|uniref:Uncharacterized protein n=1 Tax=Glarea lozoyensis (strain ATCC 74030 / MF5533) TaxID=1104152 RepID=H0EF64_GLAL7|nr:hypothetical protein M7I_1102 [Glarea lozoyensis 74030]
MEWLKLTRIYERPCASMMNDYPGCVIKMEGHYDDLTWFFGTPKKVSCLIYVCKEFKHAIKGASVAVKDERKAKKCPLCPRSAPVRYLERAKGESGWV